MNREKSSKSPPILIVDDDKDFLTSIESMLIFNGLTNVECCQDSREVIPLLEKKKYSLILLDLIMPHISGRELLPQIVEKFPEIPVIVLTGDEVIETVFECMQNGAFDFIPKSSVNSRILPMVRDSLDFIDLANENNILKEVDLSSEKVSHGYSKAALKMNFLLRTWKAPLVISKFAPVIENKEIDKTNVNLFYAMGQAYEKIEDFIKAEDIYRVIEEFDPGYPGIKEKLENLEKVKKEIIKIYHKDRYDKIEEVGKGGIGIVYKAKDKILERTVALKILNQSAIKDQRDIERFCSEAKKVARLKHPNIVDVYNYGQIGNDYFITMEFIEGINLFDLIERKHPIVIEVILLIARELFKALAHSHQNGITHRDIKPRNIMITYENEVKVLDFGIAVLIDDLIKDEKDVISGTPLYMSPEQIQHSETDHRTDIYSAGVTIFHLVTGSIPFDGNTYLEIMEKHLKEPVPSIKEYRADIPEKLIKIIEKCMAKNKENRYQSTAQVLKELNGIKDSSGNAFITEQARLKIFDRKKLSTTISCEDPQILKRKLEKYLQNLNDADMTIRTKIGLVNDIVDIGGNTASEVLKIISTYSNKKLAKAARDGLKSLGQLKRYFEEFIDKMDIPTFIYHLVLSRHVSPELLLDLNPVAIRNAIQDICPEEKGFEDLVPALQNFEKKNSNQKPDPLWHSWLTTVKGERIKEVRRMLEEIINP